MHSKLESERVLSSFVAALSTGTSSDYSREPPFAGLEPRLLELLTLLSPRDGSGSPAPRSDLAAPKENVFLVLGEIDIKGR